MVPAHRGTESYLKCLNVVPCGVKLMLKKNEIFHMAKLFICQFYTGLGIWHCTEHLWLDPWLSLQQLELRYQLN